MEEQRNFVLDLDNEAIEIQAVKCLKKDLCEKYMIFPYNIVKDTLYIAVTKSLEKGVINELKFITRKKIEFYITTKLHIAKYINHYYGKHHTDSALRDLQQEKKSSIQGDEATKKEHYSTVGPAIEAVDSIIINAVNSKASDIHIEPFSEYVTIKFRIDGSLVTFNTFSKDIYDSLCTRIKIISKMNIANKHLPQDGRFSQILNGEEFDFRVSTLPTINGEKFVIRVLHKQNNILSFEGLGFTPKDSEMLGELIKSRQGLILITGPTGSGKTSTLYSMLKGINDGSRNVVTVEEPVEYRLEGINQVSINNQGELTFHKVLRSILRQDPDVIMVGEINEEVTASTAIRAASTGHLVLTTLHTNDAASSINRLVDLNVSAYLLSDAILVVIAQRLARKICTYCKVSYKASYHERMILNLHEGSQLYRGKGCSKCNDTGFRGRTVAYEIMTIDEKHKKIICSSNNSEDLRKYAINNGMKSLKEHFRELVIRGETTIEEYLYNIGEFNEERLSQVYNAI
jgi:type IV pilus assembly protein PilB